jgi:hypothetical protein
MLRVPSQLINVPIIIPGHPYVKKNTAKGSGTGNYWTSKNYQLWANSAYYHLAHDHGHVLPIDQPINLRCLFYLAKNLHVDQSNLYEGIQRRSSKRWGTIGRPLPDRDRARWQPYASRSKQPPHRDFDYPSLDIYILYNSIYIDKV